MKTHDEREAACIAEHIPSWYPAVGDKDTINLDYVPRLYLPKSFRALII